MDPAELTPVTLYCIHGSGDLDDAIQLAGDHLDPATATCMWWSASEARWEPLPATPNPDAFEFRAFDGTSEIRWLRQGDVGALGIVSEVRGAEQSLPEAAVTEYQAITALPTSYVLWGTATGTGVLAEDRIGQLAVPGVQGTGRFALTAVEYIGVDDRTGTAYVMEERLCGVAPASHADSQSERGI